MANGVIQSIMKKENKIILLRRFKLNVMKKISLTIFILTVVFYRTYSQDNNCITNQRFAQNAQFYFDTFQKGTVVFNDNSTADGILNYNLVTNDIYYLEDKNFYSLDRKNIKYVLICKSQFYFYKVNVLELVYSKKNQILVQRKIANEDLYDKKGAYGATSPNTVGTDLQYINVTPTPGNSHIVNLRKENDKELNITISFLIKIGDKFYPATKKSFIKIYSEHKEIIQRYFEENNFNFGNKDDLIKISDYCMSL